MLILIAIPYVSSPIRMRREDPVNLGQRFRVNEPTIVHEIIDGEAVIINLATGSYYSLDRAGADVWDALAGRATAGDIVDIVVDRYEGSPADIRHAVQSFLKRLQQEELILAERLDGPAAANGGPSLQSDPARREKSPFEPFNLQKYTDMNQLLLLDPVHDADESGWPAKKADGSPPSI